MVHWIMIECLIAWQAWQRLVLLLPQRWFVPLKQLHLQVRVLIECIVALVRSWIELTRLLGIAQSWVGEFLGKIRRLCMFQEGWGLIEGHAVYATLRRYVPLRRHQFSEITLVVHYLLLLHAHRSRRHGPVVVLLRGLIAQSTKLVHFVKAILNQFY